MAHCLLREIVSLSFSISSRADHTSFILFLSIYPYLTILLLLSFLLFFPPLHCLQPQPPAVLSSLPLFYFLFSLSSLFFLFYSHPVIIPSICPLFFQILLSLIFSFLLSLCPSTIFLHPLLFFLPKSFLSHPSLFNALPTVPTFLWFNR